MLSTDPSTDEQAIRAVETRLTQGVLQRDRAALDQTLADDLVAVGHTGNVVGKADYIRIHLDPARVFTRFDTEDVQVRPFGDAALMTGKITVVNAHATTPERPARYTAMYVRQQAGWQIVSWQETPIEEHPKV